MASVVGKGKHSGTHLETEEWIQISYNCGTIEKITRSPRKVSLLMSLIKASTEQKNSQAKHQLRDSYTVERGCLKRKKEPITEGSSG